MESNYSYPVVSFGVSMQEIPDHIAFVINIGNCVQGCKGCHSADVMRYPSCIAIGACKFVPLATIIEKASKAHDLGADVCCIMGGTTNVGVSRDSLTALIKELAQIFAVGLYSGSDDSIFDTYDDSLPNDINCYLAHSTPLTYIKTGAYKADLGGLDKPTTNQRYYVREKDNEWHDCTSLFQDR